MLQSSTCGNVRGSRGIRSSRRRTDGNPSGNPRRAFRVPRSALRKEIDRPAEIKTAERESLWHDQTVAPRGIPASRPPGCCTARTASSSFCPIGGRNAHEGLEAPIGPCHRPRHCGNTGWAVWPLALPFLRRKHVPEGFGRGRAATVGPRTATSRASASARRGVEPRHGVSGRAPCCGLHPSHYKSGQTLLLRGPGSIGPRPGDGHVGRWGQSCGVPRAPPRAQPDQVGPCCSAAGGL